MSETTMPAAEAEEVVEGEERSNYELAFHVLPTVAEGEVSAVLEEIKNSITTVGGECVSEEIPARFELAYEITKSVDGKYRKFTSAYFGWVRFSAEASVVADLTSEVEARPDILRHLLIKLTKMEEESPFNFHESLASEKMVTEAGDSEEKPIAEKVKETVVEPEKKEEASEDAKEEKKEA